MEQTEPKKEENPTSTPSEEVKKTETVTTGQMPLKRQKVGDGDGKELTVKSTKIEVQEEIEDGPEETKEETKETPVEKQKLPKKKLAMVVGYNGSEFCGSQKQGDVRTVEEDLEKALYEQGMIDFRNYGDLKKIRFTRATRTDKRVHALQNYFAGKLLVDPEKSLEQYVDEINERLPKDMRLFSLINVMGGFDAKNAVTNREYDYYLPTFMLSQDVNIKYIVPEGDQPVQNLDPDNPKSIKRVKIDLDKSELESIYAYRLPEEKKEMFSRLLKKFEGTHKFHNYTKGIKAKDSTSQRYMMEVRVVDYRVFDGIEFARVFLKGQSFLYNQIRKMMGACFMVMHYGLSENFIDNSLKDNDVNVPTAPGQGLMLNKVAYDRYNRERHGLREKIKPWAHKLEEIEKFRIELVNYI